MERIRFSLINQHNESVTAKQLSGKHMIVFFGYTSCPDICPTQLYKLDRAYKKLEKNGKAQMISPVFISVDPERDTQEQIEKYLSVFHSDIQGLTGTRAQLKQATESFHTLLQAPPASLDVFYTVTHSSLYYVVDEFGRIVDHIPYEADISSILKIIESLI